MNCTIKQSCLSGQQKAATENNLCEIQNSRHKQNTIGLWENKYNMNLSDIQKVAKEHSSKTSTREVWKHIAQEQAHFTTNGDPPD